MDQNPRNFIDIWAGVDKQAIPILYFLSVD